MRLIALATMALLPLPLSAQNVLETAVDAHIIPRYQAVAETAQALEQAAIEDCAFESPNLQAAYHTAFDAWIAVTHLRFGPSEVDNRAFAMAFWPDKKGFTAKALNGLIAAQDPIVESTEAFSQMSIAGRGFFALDTLLFDPAFQAQQSPYTCQLVQAITVDISQVADAILQDWQSEYGDYLITAGAETNPLYLTEMEGMQELFKAVLTGLEFTQAQRLGRPMGSFERPRPARAEARRSGRSNRNIIVALQSVEELANILTASVGGGVAKQADDGLAYALRLAEDLDDPVLASVATFNGRFRVEALQSSIIASIGFITEELGPALGVNPGFNALDGD